MSGYKTHPAIGAFAPCAVYVYRKKDDNKIHMAFPFVYKWMVAIEIEDKDSMDVLLDAKKKFEVIL